MIFMKRQVVEINEAKQPCAWFSVTGVIFICIICFLFFVFFMLPGIYDVSDEFYFRKSLEGE